MAKLRTYVDTGVLLAAFRGAHPLSRRALAILDDEAREFIISGFLRLEALPKPTFYRRREEVEFMETFFRAAALEVEATPELIASAIRLAGSCDVAPMDSLHAAAAICGDASEFVTTEKPDKPLFRVSGIKVISIAEAALGIPPAK
jgi:predicted nucleic acid-binding protein